MASDPDPDQLLRRINEVLTMAPEFGDQNVTLPLGAILDWTMGTPAGFAAFRDPKVNAALKKILLAWCEYLNSPESLYVLTRRCSDLRRNREALRMTASESLPGGLWTDLWLGVAAIILSCLAVLPIAPTAAEQLGKRGEVVIL